MRKPCCEKQQGVVINKGAWSKQEDQKLIDYISVHGEGCWRSLPKAAGLHRCGKSCRLRWINYLRPDIKRGNFDLDEEDLIIKLHALLGNRWSLIAGRLPGRTDNEVKNYWNSHIRKKLIRMGVDPNNHKPHQHRPPRMAAHGSPTSQITESSSSMEDASTNPSNCKNDNDVCNETQGKIGGGGGGGVRRVSNVVVSCVDHEETSSSAALDLNLDLTIATSPSPSTQLRFLERKEAHANSSKVVKVELEGHEELEPSPALVLFR